MEIETTIHELEYISDYGKTYMTVAATDKDGKERSTREAVMVVIEKNRHLVKENFLLRVKRQMPYSLVDYL